LRIVVFVFDTVVFMIFIMLRTPPMIGSKHKGSGALKSMNHRKPSVVIYGDTS